MVVGGVVVVVVGGIVVVVVGGAVVVVVGAAVVVVVVGAAVVVVGAAVVVVVASVVVASDGDRSTSFAASLESAVVAVGAASTAATVWARRLASTEPATLPDAVGGKTTPSTVADVSMGGGENAAKPTTASRRMMSTPTRASGDRGRTSAWSSALFGDAALLARPGHSAWPLR